MGKPKSLTERIATAKARQEKLAARLAELESKAKQQDRKRDTRRKILIGAAVLEELERRPEIAAYVRAMLHKAILRPQDRTLLADLIGPPAPPAVNDTAFPTPAMPPRQASA